MAAAPTENPTMLKIDQRWFIAEGKQQGLPVVIRARQNLREKRGLESHPTLLRICWQFEPEPGSGLPNPEVGARMEAFEQALFQELESDFICIFFCVYRHDGVQRWFAYTADIEVTCERINSALAGHDRYPIEMTAEPDPAWQEYADLLEGTGKLKNLKEKT